ncbi:cell cycle histidine kinase CckA [Polycladidibacter hongkongensis]|uniref:cell cycle histidine kinase CckA n=1 Tax=Polycladidibacter hongkongensis TaxID=1647556 RepID=UPI000834F9E7|nr:response regulator [Pseudovibrio hongkongensis]
MGNAQQDGIGDLAATAPRAGSFVMLAGLCIMLGGAVALLALLGLQVAEPYLYGLLGVLALVGVAALFAYAVGLLRFGEQVSAPEWGEAYLNSLEDGVVLCDSDGRIVYTNPAYARMSGQPAHGELRSVARLFSADPDAADAMFRLAQAQREGRQAEEEIRLPYAVSGLVRQPHWYRVGVRPMQRVATRGEVHSIWQLRDISSERDAQENSFQELQKVINFLDHAPGGFFSVNGQGRIVYLNATLATWLGHDLASSSDGSLALSQMVHGDGAALLSSMSGEEGEVKTQSFDLDLVGRGGKTIPVRLVHQVPFGVDGMAGDSRTLVLTRLEGRQDEEALRAAEVRFARFFNNSPIAIATLSASGAVVRHNGRFLKLMQDNVQGVEGQPFATLIGGDASRGFSTALEAAKAGQGDIPPVEVSMEVEGRQRSATCYVCAIDEQDDGQEVAVVYALETTQQRALEEQFAQSQKMQAIGQLAGGVAHDFNNVLTAIIGFSDLLLASHRPTDPAFPDIMNIKQNANRAAGLVRQLLAFSRRQTLRPKELVLGDVLADLDILLNRLLGEKIELKVVHGRDLWPVMADVNQLEQVIMNLAVNARDAMPEGGEVRVLTANVDESGVAGMEQAQIVPKGDYVMIEVSDSGHGMSAQVREKIFEPFFSTKEVGKGTGLGLSTVYGIVKQTGGYIFCESKEGEGTCFRILLPRFAAPEKHLEAEKKAEPQKVADLTGSARILLVEDEEAVRAFAARALSSRGYEVFEAGSGTEALEVMEEEGGAMDLVVSDVVMPEMDGPSLLVELRKMQPDLKIIFVSGYAEEAFEKNLPAEETFNFLPKPFTLKQLATTVKEVLAE